MTSKLFELYDAFSEEYTYTENGALTFKTSGKAVVDLFSLGGAMRKASSERIVSLFKDAYKEDPVGATVVLFYLRDAREGQGERNFFRQCLVWLADVNPSLVSLLIPYVPDYGRWDDLFCLKACKNKAIYEKALKHFAGRLEADKASLLINSEISLAGKWAPSEQSGKESRQHFHDLRKVMGVSERQYRKLVTKLRERLRIVETDLSTKNYKNIRYSAVPSCAAKMYRNAFMKHDKERYTQYLANVAKGTEKINASVLYPYDIVASIRQNYYAQDDALEAMWKALPKFETKGLAIVDTSGSMFSKVSDNVMAVDVALSIGLYIAENNTTQFKNQFITFSNHPEFVKINPSASLSEKLKSMSQADWRQTTNLQKVFSTILNLATSRNLKQEDLPDTIYITSDMEFNQSGENDTNFEAIRNKYASAGYTMPNIVFWNVCSRQKQSPVKFNEQGVALVSGCSPNILRQVLEGSFNPTTLIDKLLNSERYGYIVEAVKAVPFK